MKFLILFLVLFFSKVTGASIFTFDIGSKANFDTLMNYFNETSEFYNCEINIKKSEDLYHLYIKSYNPVNQEAILTVEFKNKGESINRPPLKVAIQSNLTLKNYLLLEYLTVRSDIHKIPIEIIYTEIKNQQVRRIICAPEL